MTDKYRKDVYTIQMIIIALGLTMIGILALRVMVE